MDSTELAPEDSALRSAASIGDGGDISDRVQGAYDTNVIIAAEDLSTPPSP